MELKKYKDKFTEHTYYEKDGKVVRHGIGKGYYLNGKLESENNFKNGKIINFKGYGIWGRIKTIVYMMYHGRRSYIKGVTLNVIAIGRKVLGRY